MGAYDIDIRDVRYGEIDGKALEARLYRPRVDHPIPGVVEVHGGAWTSNDRTTNVDIDRPLAESGAVVMAIDFRMPPDVRYPEPVADINLAVRWLKSKSKSLGVAAGQVGLLGTSSGGHQAMLAAMRPEDPRYAAHPLDGGNDASVDFIMLCWSIVDPHARYKMVKEKANLRLVEAHHAYWPDEPSMEEGNPQLILERGEPAKTPPALFLQGTADDNMTPDMADRFAKAYRQAGGDLRLEKFDGAPHAFVAKDPSSAHAVRAVDLIRDFVHEQAARA